MLALRPPAARGFWACLPAPTSLPAPLLPLLPATAMHTSPSGWRPSLMWPWWPAAGGTRSRQTGKAGCSLRVGTRWAVAAARQQPRQVAPLAGGPQHIGKAAATDCGCSAHHPGPARSLGSVAWAAQRRWWLRRSKCRCALHAACCLAWPTLPWRVAAICWPDRAVCLHGPSWRGVLGNFPCTWPKRRPAWFLCCCRRRWRDRR